MTGILHTDLGPSQEQIVYCGVDFAVLDMKRSLIENLSYVVYLTSLKMLHLNSMRTVHIMHANRAAACQYCRQQYLHDCRAKLVLVLRYGSM